MKAARLAIAAVLFSTAFAVHAWGQFRVPRIPAPRPVPIRPAPHLVPHGGTSHDQANAEARDDTTVWWITGGAAGGGGLLYVLYRSWKWPRRSFRIRVVATPPGEAPESVRRAWVGLELPLTAGGDGSPRMLPAAGIMSDQPEEPKMAYAVDGPAAISLLEAHDSAAAA